MNGSDHFRVVGGEDKKNITERMPIWCSNTSKGKGSVFSTTKETWWQEYAIGSLMDVEKTFKFTKNVGGLPAYFT